MRSKVQLSRQRLSCNPDCRVILTALTTVTYMQITIQEGNVEKYFIKLDVYLISGNKTLGYETYQLKVAAIIRKAKLLMLLTLLNTPQKMISSSVFY